MKDILTIPVKLQKLERENILKLLKEMRTLDHEEAAIIYIKGDYADGIIKSIQFVSKNQEKFSTDVDMKKLIVPLLTEGVDSIILVHNHPDEEFTPVPSTNDINFTNELIGICEDFGVDVIDSLIISKNSEFFFDDHDLIIEPTIDKLTELGLFRQFLFRSLSKIFPKFKKYCFF